MAVSARPEISAVCMDPKDSVVTVTRAVKAGEQVSWLAGTQVMTVQAAGDIPIYHKMAVRPLCKGDFVLKYGEKIGVATEDIQLGEHVHVHNLASAPQAGTGSDKEVEL